MKPNAGTEQHDKAFPAFETLWKLHPAQQIIELGTGTGTFTNWLARRFDIPVHTFDHKNRWQTCPHPNVSEHLIDIFHNTELIAALLKRPLPTWLLCDNGNKPMEVSMFAEHLKRTDLILAHDFYERKELVTSEWVYCEIVLEDIPNTITPIHEAVMYPVFWFCGKLR